MVVVLPKYASLVGVVAVAETNDISKKTHPADDAKPLLPVIVHVCVCGVDCTLLHGDPTVPLDIRDEEIVCSTNCEALDGATVLDHIFEVPETSKNKRKGIHNATKTDLVHCLDLTEYKDAPGTTPE